MRAKGAMSAPRLIERRSQQSGASRVAKQRSCRLAKGKAQLGPPDQSDDAEQDLC